MWTVVTIGVAVEEKALKGKILTFRSLPRCLMSMYNHKKSTKTFYLVIVLLFRCISCFARIQRHYLNCRNHIKAKIVHFYAKCFPKNAFSKM